MRISIGDLENFLMEFYDPSSSPTRRLEIQSVLVNFGNSPNAWYHAICYLSMAKNQYIVLYCLGIVETTIIRQWPLLSKDDKLKIRLFLKTYLSRNCLDQSSFLLKKTSKLLSLIVCFDWPDQYSDYVDFFKSHIFNNSSNNLIDLRISLVGLYCLRSTYESFLNPPELISYSKRIELQQFLRKETSSFCGLLCSIISHLCSDVNGVNLVNLSQSYLLRQNSHLDQNSQHSFWHPLLMFLESLTSDCLTNSGSKCYAIIACFECLCEVLKLWSGQPDFLAEILILIFLFSMIGSSQCLSACVESEVALSLSSHDCDLPRLIGLTALTCLQELVEKRNVDSLIKHQSSFVFHLITCHINLASGRIVLNKISLKNDENNSDISSTLAMDRQKQARCDDYEMKLVEIIQCLLPSCLKFVYVRDNSANKFSMNDLTALLQAFFEFTFFTSNFETYLSCMNIWCSVFESLQFSICQLSDFLSSNSDVHRILIEFGNALFSRLFYSESSAYLDTLDYDIFENEESYISSTINYENSLLYIVFPEDSHANNSTNSQNYEPCEYMIFIRESLSTLRHLVDLLPNDFTVLIFQRFQCILNEYTSLVNSTGLSSGVFNYPKSLPIYRIHWILRDFASIVQVIGFMSEKFCCEKYQECGQHILRSLMYCLRLSSTIFPALHNINERLIRLSFVEVIVQVFLVWRALIVSGSIGFITDCNNLSYDKIYLSSTECIHFYSELMEIFQCFLKPLNDTSLSPFNLISSRIMYSCAQLFKCLFTTSFRDIRPPSSIIFNVNSSTFTLFNNLFESVCQHKCQIPMNYNVLNLLVSGFLFYLTTENEIVSHLSNCKNMDYDEQNKLTSIRNSLLNRLIAQLFLPNLNQNHFDIAQKQYVIYLSLLNHSILSLENSGNASRQLVYTLLTNSGLMDNLVSCLLNKILSNDPSCSIHLTLDMKNKFCTAYLIFLATFIRILSISTISLSSIPQLIGQIIHSLRTTLSSLTTSNSFSTSVIGPIIDILLLITHHKIFLPILQDTFELCICVFLPILSTIPNATYTDDEQCLRRLVCNACASNSQLMQQLFELLFTILSNNFAFFFSHHSVATVNTTTPSSSSLSLSMNKSTILTPIIQRCTLNHPDMFHRLMFILSVVLHSEQVNSNLVKFIIEKLIRLNALHKLFDLYDFNKTWLSIFITSILNLLIDNKHDSCKDTLTESVYFFAASYTHWSCSLNSGSCNCLKDNSYNDRYIIDSSNSNDYQSNGLLHFVQQFLPSYMNTIHGLDNGQCASIISCFYDTNQTHLYLKDNTIFNHCIELLVYNVQYCRLTFGSHVISTIPKR
ncbi:Exportin-6 [Schistosoma japonicum]|nr:Exportin-6 [Schistosoma japonicum]